MYLFNHLSLMSCFNNYTMKRSIKIPLFVALLLSQITACKRDFLKPEPLSTLTTENVYTNREGFESLLVTMRKNLKNESYGDINFTVCEYSASELGVPITQLDFYKLTPNTDRYYKFLAMYTTAYKCIKDANVLISRIDNITWTDKKTHDAMVAEAYWHRAYWYYRLVNNYGDVPWIGEEIVGAKLDFQTYSRWPILDKLKSDLEFAVQWLPISAAAGAISQGAGYHLLAKVDLAGLKFDQAIEAASKVINGPYSLMQNRFGVNQNNANYNVIWDLHRPQNLNTVLNTETILATVDRFEAPPGAKSTGTYTMRLYNCAWWTSSVKDSKGQVGTVLAGPIKDTLGRGNANVRLSPFYEYDVWAYGGQTWRNTTDLRRSNNNWMDISEILYNNPASVDFGKPINPANYATLTDTLYTLFAMPTYITYVQQEDPLALPFGGNGDWYIFRLAETYLLRAEAYYWKGQLEQAANDINKVRTRAKALPITPAEVTLDFIFDESARELFGEQPRHAEMVRASYILASQNKNGYSLATFSDKNYYYDRVDKLNILYKQKVSLIGNVAAIAPFHVLWPVPATVILTNTLGRINQNAKYDGADKNIPPLTAPIN